MATMSESDIAQVQALIKTVEALQGEVTSLKSTNDVLLKLQRTGGGAGGGYVGRRGLIDVKELQRMVALESSKQWADWSTRFKDAVMARGHPAARCAMDAVENSVERDAGVWKGADVARATDENWSDIHIEEETWTMWANDLYYILEDMSKGDATVIIRNSTIAGVPGVIAQDGFRAWRCLKLAMNPRTPARRLQCFMDVVQVTEVKDKREVNIAINVWLRKVAKLQTEFKETLSASLRTALLISMLPKDMQVAALQQVDMKDDSEDETVREGVLMDIVEKVKSVINSEVARTTPQPMEGVTIGALKAAAAAGQAAAADQGEWAWHGEWPHEEQHEHYYEIDAIGNGECFSCGQKGHRAAECPKGKGKGVAGKGGWNAYGSGKGKGKGYTSPGYAYAGKGYFNMAPKGFGKGQWEQPRRRACFGCGSLEHLQRDCPKMLAAVEGEPTNVQLVGFEEEVTIIGNVMAEQKDGFKAVKARKKRTYRKFNPDEATEICAVNAGIEETVVGMTFQATDVKKALAAVWRVCEKGNLVQFGEDPEDCFSKNKKSGRKIYVRKKGRSYVMDVEFVKKENGETISMGKGEITIDSAAEESVCPKDWGGAFVLKTARKTMNFKTANGQSMQHYGERLITCIAESRPGQPSAGFAGHP
jgi:hypothetical protein